jgi:hypothetical protein
VTGSTDPILDGLAVMADNVRAAASLYVAGEFENVDQQLTDAGIWAAELRADLARAELARDEP